MNNISNYIIPILVIILIIFARIKKLETYNIFVNGAKGAFNLVIGIFPYIVAIMIMVALFRASGLSNYIIKLISPIFNFLGIPNEVCELILLRPFTGSGSFALLKDVYANYGVDSYIGRCASVIMGTSETLFYVSTVYFSGTSIKKLGYAIPVAIICNIFGAIISCLICRIF